MSVDVGAGTGLLTRELARPVDAKVYATEISQGFLDYLKKDDRIDKEKVHLIKCESQRLVSYKNVEFINVDKRVGLCSLNYVTIWCSGEPVLDQVQKRASASLRR